jgi:hypothetical protein
MLVAPVAAEIPGADGFVPGYGVKWTRVSVKIRVAVQQRQEASS